jgi:CRISPR/Cas system CSM-associated protein Csm3 (group 7 of RAMP superfamily)
MNQFKLDGNVREIAARWVITTNLTLTSAAHFGGESNSSVDMPVLREESFCASGNDSDTGGGSPILPGTTLGGALRNHLSDVLGGYGQIEHRDVRLLFGESKGGTDQEIGQSAIVVFDSVVEGTPATEMRDGVAIDGKSGCAEENKKFDFEVLPAGTVFPLRFDIVVPGEVDEKKLLSLFLTTVLGLTDGGIALGARRTRGCGNLRAGHWKAARFDLNTATGWKEWLACRHLNPNQALTAHDQAGKAIAACLGETVPPLDDKHDKRLRTVFEVLLELKSMLLIRCAGMGSDEPDLTHLTSGGRSIVSGTSLAGALRNRALRIASLVRSEQGDGAEWVDQIFGAREADKAAAASKLRISESPIENGERIRLHRIRLDRLTQGVVSGALFDEESQYMGKCSMRFELRSSTPGEVGLVLLVLRDLAEGDIPLGGSSATGHGAVQGSVQLVTEHGPSPLETTWCYEQIMAFHAAPRAEVQQ